MLKYIMQMNIGLKTAGVLLFLIFIISPKASLQAQVTVEVKMDTNMMLIGDQTNVWFEATFPDTMMVSLPVFADTIIKKLEIVSVSDIDTIRENNLLKINQRYLVTCFDSGWYVVPPLDFLIGFPKANRVDTIHSVPVYFGVMTLPIDTANADAIADIKAPLDAPITFKEILPFLGIGLGVLILAFLAYLLYMKIAKKQPVFVKKEKPKEPAHLVAFRDLDALKTEKLWQKGLVKLYHSKLTEIVRVYIEDRFGILAMESTTEEIMEAFRLSGDLEKSTKDSLFDMLTLADFVKFAKAEPLADENEQSLAFAYQFVIKTKPVEVLREEDEVEDLKETKKVE